MPSILQIIIESYISLMSYSIKKWFCAYPLIHSAETDTISPDNRECGNSRAEDKEL